MGGSGVTMDVGLERTRVRRLVVDLWYVPCVLAPLLACISSPAWYLALAHPRGPTVRAVLGLLAAGWIPWLLALFGTVALATKYEIRRLDRGRTEADAWDQFAVRLLAATAGIGVVLTLLWVGLILSVATT